MKILYKYSLIIASVFFLFSCTKETEGVSRITNYVEFAFKGDNPAIVQVGEPYKDAGVIATLEGKDVSSTVTVKSNVDYETMGMYKVEYRSVNSDGLTSRAIRDVIICNPSVTTDLSGAYTVADGTNRVALASGAKVLYNGYPVSLSKVAPGFFTVSDFFGGYYEKRAGYGSAYAMKGYIALNEDNTINMVSSSIAGWGDSLDSLNDASYDPVTGKISWGAVYAGAYSFNVILTK
jgi:hypothetical protein